MLISNYVEPQCGAVHEVDEVRQPHGMMSSLTKIRRKAHDEATFQ